MVQVVFFIWDGVGTREGFVLIDTRIHIDYHVPSHGLEWR